jgi:copper chaperone CopZ
MPERRTIEVTGMACTGCEENVESALQSLDGVRRVEADHEGGTVEVVVDDALGDDDLGTAIHDAGYEVVA